MEPGKDKAADDLAINLQAAFLSLRDEMLAEGRGAWYSPEPTSYPLSCEMPANWFGYGEEIRWDTEHSSGPPTARVKASLTTWGDLGNGLLIMMLVPAARSGDVNRLNRLDEQARGATHFVGAWAPFNDDAVYLIFLPAALLEQDIAWPVVMREILLTFARQAQLARRVVLDPATQMMLDGGTVQPVGFEASLKPHGLAWGETGEGRNPAAWHLDGIYRLLVGEDSDWAYPAESGFTWWPYQQAQTIVAVQRDDQGAAIKEVVRIRVATEVRANVPATPEALIAIAKRNASLAESALVLRDDGTLVLDLSACHDRSALRWRARMGAGSRDPSVRHRAGVECRTRGAGDARRLGASGLGAAAGARLVVRTVRGGDAQSCRGQARRHAGVPPAGRADGGRRAVRPPVSHGGAGRRHARVLLASRAHLLHRASRPGDPRDGHARRRRGGARLDHPQPSAGRRR